MSVSLSRQLISEHALLRLGTTVQNYRLTRLLGIGGMAAVYAATDEEGQWVAVKFMLERLHDDQAMFELFNREAVVANQVGHPRAVPVLDQGVDDDGCAYLIMPLLEGETLRAHWERANKLLPPSSVFVLMSDVLDVRPSVQRHSFRPALPAVHPTLEGNHLGHTQILRRAHGESPWRVGGFFQSSPLR